MRVVLKRARARTCATIHGLEEPIDTLLLLLTYYDRLPFREQQLLTAWARSEDGSARYAYYVDRFGAEQSYQQVVLTVAALVCFQQLIIGTSSPTEPQSGSRYFADLDIFLCHEVVKDDCAIIQQICAAILVKLPTEKYLLGIVAQALGNVYNPPSSCCELFEKYVGLRMLQRSHTDARDFVEAYRRSGRADLWK